MAIPEQPSNENIGPVLASLQPPVALVPVLCPGVNRNGRSYSPEAIANACEQAKAMVREKRLLVFEADEAASCDLRDVIGIVEHAEVQNGALMVEVKFLNPLMNELRPAISFYTSGVGSVVDGVVQNDYKLESISVACLCAPKIN